MFPCQPNRNFYIGGEGRNLMPRALSGSFLMVHSNTKLNLVFLCWLTPPHYLHNVLGFFHFIQSNAFNALLKGLRPKM